MMLFMGVTVILALAVPYLMKYVDPETMKDITEQQQRIAKAQNVDLSSGLSNLLAGATSGPSTGGNDSPSKSSKAKGKRR